MEFHESKTLTLPIAKHESLQPSKCIFNLGSHLKLSFVVIGRWWLSLPVTIPLSSFTFTFWFLVHIGNRSSCFGTLLANHPLQSIAIYGIMMIATYMLFIIALGLKNMYAEASEDTP